MVIRKFEGEYEFLSNEYICNMSEFTNSVRMSTVEHYYQSMKAAGFGKRDEIRSAATPEEARHIAHNIRPSKRTPNWETVKVKHMKTLINRKFSINPALCKKLIATGDAEIVYENTVHDNFWGNCTCPQCLSIKGKNMLGKILMDFRKKHMNTSSRFINDDVKLKHGGRKSIKMTVDELHDKLQKRYISLTGDTPVEFCPIITVEEFLFNDSNIQKDNKFIGSFSDICDNANDNFYCELKERSTGKSLLGFHTLNNGLTIYGFMVEGDETGAIFALFYYDGKKVRMYTPIRGNLVNVDCRCSICGIPNEDTDYDELETKYRNLGSWQEDDVDCYSNWDIMYLEKYNIYPGMESFNWDAIREDIESRIEIV